MKFLINMNLPRELGRQLTAKGHDCRHAGDVGMAQASDLEITEDARASGEVILTHDLDYGHILAFSGDIAPSVIIFRLRNTGTDNLINRLMDAWHEIEKPLLAGAIVVMQDSAVRIRGLPIAQVE
jgi:predicted nuclease of predicted toxin-antitoxin system